MHPEAAVPQLPPESARARDAVLERLPAKAGVWTRSGKPQIITAKGIFDYMDGAGELYIGYRFRLLDVVDYTSADQDDIQVEIYWMESPDDAFGLLSNDWGGEPVDIAGAGGSKGSVAPAHRALYGAGLLRLASGDLYARIMAFRAGDASRNAVVEIARSIEAGRDAAAQPGLLDLLPPEVASHYRPRADRLCYFRSHLVLNSVYFLSTANLLNLGLKTEAVTVPYESSSMGKRVSFRTLLIRYPVGSEARAGLQHFLNIYVPEKTRHPAQERPELQDVIKIEDGWMGYELKNAHLALVFECPDPETARSFLDRALASTTGMEESHE